MKKSWRELEWINSYYFLNSNQLLKIIFIYLYIRIYLYPVPTKYMQTPWLPPAPLLKSSQFFLHMFQTILCFNIFNLINFKLKVNLLTYFTYESTKYSDSSCRSSRLFLLLPLSSLLLTNKRVWCNHHHQVYKLKLFLTWGPNWVPGEHRSNIVPMVLMGDLKLLWKNSTFARYSTGYKVVVCLIHSAAPHLAGSTPRRLIIGPPSSQVPTH